MNNSKFPIVGIGASAGGLVALEQFFKEMPDKIGHAFVVIQHLDPNHIGMMPEILQRSTTMEVFEARDGENVKPDCIYVIPPKKNLSILNGILHLFDPVEPMGLRLPINVFFESLASDRQHESIGIILSGMGTDGTLGLKAIKGKNGLAMVQDPSSAKFDGMPRSAIGMVNVDFVAPVDKLAQFLMTSSSTSSFKKNAIQIDRKLISNVARIIILIREKTGHDFSLYKKATLLRRIERRMGIHQIGKISNYERYLQENPSELELLFKEFLIGVTGFFRDRAVWEMLKEIVLPELISKLPEGYPLRAWVTACSTGEEAYSLAIIFKETIEKIDKSKNISLQIFATDIDYDAITIARRGRYSKKIEKDVSPERLKKFYNEEVDGYALNPSIREMVVFAHQDITKDPPFTKLDIITCRNLLIYMEVELQQKLISLFSYSLNSEGILVLGSSESLGERIEGFIALDIKLKIYRLSTSGKILADLPNSFYYNKVMLSKDKRVIKLKDNIQSITDQIILQHFSPQSVLVNQKGDILYITGRTGKYLEPAAGKVNWNIHAMARPEIGNILPSAFRKVSKSDKDVTIKNLKLVSEEGVHFIDLTVRNFNEPAKIEGMILVIFKAVRAPVEDVIRKPQSEKQLTSRRIKELEEELQQCQEDLSNAGDEMQISREELRSTNEELQSTNEELQSTNEELTTSKEELESLNEELHTVNTELQSKISDYVRTNDDMKNLLNSTEIATLFLDKRLNIRRFTDNVIQVFKIRKADIGRPFTDLVSSLNYPEIDVHAKKVIKDLISFETDVSALNGKWFSVRIMPYRTIDDRIDGLVITFSNITEAKVLEHKLRDKNEELTILEKTKLKR